MYRYCLFLSLLIPVTAKAEPDTIIHMLNTHYVGPGEFAADLKDQDSEITQEEIDKAYSQFLRSVESTQQDQMRSLKRLIEKHQLKAVYVEGVSEKNHKGVLRFIQTLKEYEANKPEPPESAIDKLIAAQNKIDLMELGAAGRLVVSGELETILPAEKSWAFDAANPLLVNGAIKFDKFADERREDEIVRNLMRADGVAVIVLGSDHDLTDNLKRWRSHSKYKRMIVAPKRRPETKPPRIKVRPIK